ncbi:hypothetical protein BO83DRAFT_48249 [Aspergillus eucalypticola CBS 122712]|uniref:Uncharacterized protein n=1 Tax=Aspergillus eucalypticola (strain CBS 122712 / IBT 29274) TaxID=1448314 RepID=A0A317VF42_ASPEC|nr:uncharacterized protein BO83DRAFT_48249 [Aspergillus eucalypticola CBS 122712]PWY72079.1 hypothetical protein BO83DRAFT_48249 [Aspergillus eucalypticola CBS 122712]
MSMGLGDPGPRGGKGGILGWSMDELQQDLRTGYVGFGYSTFVEVFSLLVNSWLRRVHLPNGWACLTK